MTAAMWVLLGLSAFGCAEAEPPAVVGVATWNVHDLFDDRLDDPGSAETVLSTRDYEAKLERVGTVIGALDADVVVLQEIESAAVLDDLVDGQLGGAYPERIVEPTNDPRGIHVAVLSKLPVSEIVSHRTESFPVEGTFEPFYRFSRDALEVHVDCGGSRLVVLAVHFKSKSDDDPDRRLAEAQRVRAIADELTGVDPDLLPIVAGDFNDTPGSPAHEAVMGPPGSRFAAAAEAVPAEDRWSYTFAGRRELIDHQLVSPRLKPIEAVAVHDADVLLASDHAPLLVRYELPR